MTLLELHQLIKPNQSDVKASEMKLPLVMDKKNRNIGLKTKMSFQKVTVKDSKTGTVYGRRTVIQK